jgi:hypothetical protein
MAPGLRELIALSLLAGLGCGLALARDIAALECSTIDLRPKNRPSGSI